MNESFVSFNGPVILLSFTQRPSNQPGKVLTPGPRPLLPLTLTFLSVDVF